MPDSPVMMLLKPSDADRIVASLGELPRRRTQPALYLTVGLPGAGKSTFARRLADQIEAVVLESDALRRLLFRTPAHSSDESRALFSALHEAAGRLLDRGFSVIVDATSIRERDRRPLYDLAAERRLTLRLLYFTAPESVIEARLARRIHGLDPASASTAGIEVYHRMAARLQPPARSLRIDTSDEESVRAAFRRLVEDAGPRDLLTATARGTRS